MTNTKQAQQNADAFLEALKQLPREQWAGWLVYVLEHMPSDIVSQVKRDIETYEREGMW